MRSSTRTRCTACSMSELRQWNLLSIIICNRSQCGIIQWVGPEVKYIIKYVVTYIGVIMTSIYLEFFECIHVNGPYYNNVCLLYTSVSTHCHVLSQF